MTKLFDFWSEAERNFVKDNYPKLSISEVCSRINRTKIATKYQINMMRKKR